MPQTASHAKQRRDSAICALMPFAVGAKDAGKHVFSMTQPNKKNTSLTWMIVVALAVPTIPFILLGWWLEPTIESFATNAAAMQAWQSTVVIIAALAVDIFLPVPSSVLLTFAGQSLGAWQGTMVGWLGLNVSAAIGFWTSRKFGPWVLARLSTEDAIADVQRLSRSSLWLTLIACRPLPILAEASVLLAGVNRVPPTQFWPPVLMANLIIAAAYSWLGASAAKNDWFVTALVISMLLPLTFIGVRYIWKRCR